MKFKSIKLPLVFFIILSFCIVNAFDKVVPQKDGFEIILSSSSNNFTAGQNSFEVAIYKDKKVIQVDEVKVSFSMPAMPGMPKMNEEAQMSSKGDTFTGNVNFPHGGTWQIKIHFIVDGMKYQAKSSIDF